MLAILFLCGVLSTDELGRRRIGEPALERPQQFEEVQKSRRYWSKQELKDWRMVSWQGTWWYWLPDQTWAYYANGRWVRYPVVVPEKPQRRSESEMIRNHSNPFQLPDGIPGVTK